MQTEVADRPEKHRFEITADGQVAGRADYQLRGDTIAFTHTLIDDAYEGKGLGSVLVKHALDSARERGLNVLPICPFVRSWIERHPDYLPLVPESARAQYKLPG